jgi:Tn3 transposase DDE domain
LNLQPTPKPELQVLQQQLNEAYQRTASNLPNNPAVRIEVTKGRSTLTISNLDKLEESSSYLKLKAQVDDLLPHVDLPEVLLEIQAKTGFMDEFIHVNESFARVSDLSTSICAVLIASACNIGLTPLVRADVPALTRGRLTWVEQNYIEGQEEQLGALGLVVNVLVLWNTYYMDAGLNYVRSLEEEVNPLDVARLSPLGHDHINMLGRYHFHLPELLKNGGMRPLRSFDSERLQ